MKSARQKSLARQTAETDVSDVVVYDGLPLTDACGELEQEVAFLNGELTPLPGRQKQPPDNILEGRRNDIALMLEKNWYRIGCGLERLRTRKKHNTADLRTALLPLNQELSKDRVALLLRPISIPASSLDVRRTRRAQAKVHKQICDLTPRIRAQFDKCDEARRAVEEGSPQSLNALKEEITRRIQNRVQLTNEIDSKQKTLRTQELSLAALRQKDPNSSEFQQLHREVGALYIDLGNKCEAFRTEHNLIRELNQRIADATKERVEFAEQELERRQIELDRLKQEEEELQREFQRLDTLWWDQSSGFAQQEFLDFLAERRSDHAPRFYANAIAGLPEIGCRVSAPRCKAIKFPKDCLPHQHYRLFVVIQRAWDRRELHKELSIFELIRREINQLPKSLSGDGKRIKNFDRDFFHEHKDDLHRAIEYWNANAPRMVSKQMPYVVTEKFLENVYKQRTIWERIGAS